MNANLVRRGSLGFAASALIGLAGCSTPSVNLSGRDPCAQPVLPGFARLVVVRPWAFAAGGASYLIFDDDQIIGKLENDGRMCWDRYPGKAYLAYYIRDTESGLGRAFMLEAAAGQAATLEVSPDKGWRTLSKSP